MTTSLPSRVTQNSLNGERSERERERERNTNKYEELHESTLDLGRCKGDPHLLFSPPPGK